MKMRLAAIAMALLSTAAIAEVSDEEGMVCYGDAFRFCADKINLIHPDRNLIGACLWAHRTQITPACLAVMKKATGNVATPKR